MTNEKKKKWLEYIAANARYQAELVEWFERKTTNNSNTEEDEDGEGGDRPPQPPPRP